VPLEGQNAHVRDFGEGFGRQLPLFCMSCLTRVSGGHHFFSILKDSRKYIERLDQARKEEYLAFLFVHFESIIHVLMMRLANQAFFSKRAD